MALWLTAIGAVLCGWSTLAILGNERQRRLDRLDLEARVAREQAADAARRLPSVPVAREVRGGGRPAIGKQALR
jgi:hypothetical protein